MAAFERITIDSEIAHGRPVIRGTRMRVADVLALLAAGASEQEIVADYPYVTAEDVKACLRRDASSQDAREI